MSRHQRHMPRPDTATAIAAAGAAPKRTLVVRASADDSVPSERPRRGGGAGRYRKAAPEGPSEKLFLPLPKPKHLVYIKPTVAVVADVASRSSVGLKMQIGDNQLERYVIEYYSRSL